VAGDEGRGRIFTLPIPVDSSPAGWLAASTATPTGLTTFGTASSLVSIPNNRVIFMRSSFAAPNEVFVLETSATCKPTEIQLTKFSNDLLKGKNLHPGTEIWWTGGAIKDRKIQGWVFTPPNFQKGQEGQWPALLMIHGKSLGVLTVCLANHLSGGPQSLWQDMWFSSFHLNRKSLHYSCAGLVTDPLEVYAQQGYVVFAPNFTGSTSFGQDFVDAIAKDWGGAPFEDMRAGWNQFLNEYPEVNRGRTAGWGASWGGYGS
jgi:hypothetical protein